MDLMSRLAKRIFFANENENYQESENLRIMDIVERLKELMDNEARSCSMDYGCVTPLYVYRMWGGTVAIEDIATAMEEVRGKTEEIYE